MVSFPLYSTAIRKRNGRKEHGMPKVKLAWLSLPEHVPNFQVRSV